MTPFQFIRIQKKFIAHSFNVLLLFGLVAQVGTVQALTGGPSQPEVQSFQPSGVDNLVDPFTGDFSYNIPLLDIEGYPLNLSYSSGIGMEDEASWVGLGWNLSPGVVNRTVRGLPDDFNGDIVTKKMNIKKNVTLGLSGKLGKEFIGLKRKNGKTLFPSADPKIQTSLSIGINYNTYNGVNAEIASGFGMSINPALNKKNKMEDKFSLDITNSSDGLTVAPSYSLPAGEGPFTIGTSFNSHSGINSMQLGLQEIAKDLGVSASIPFGLQSYTPTIDMPMNLVSISLGAKGGHEIKFKGITANLDGYYSSQSLANKERKLPALGYMNSHNAYKYDNGFGIVAMMDVNRENDGSFNPNTPLLPVAYQMYDMFSVTTHGVSGSFRAFRNDVGYMTDPYVNSHSGGGHGNLDISIGDLSKAGVDVGVNFAENISGYWHTDTRLKYLLNYQTSDPYQDYEPYYFKKIGEAAYDSEADFRSNYGDDKPVRPEIVGKGFSATQSGKIIDDDGNVTTVSRNNAYRKKKMPRGVLFKTITRDELYRESLQNFQDIMHPAPGHHIGEVVTISEGGTEYHFGLPAYNTTKEETTFNVGEDNHWTMNAKIDKETGFVRYQNSSNSTGNTKGSDNYYSNTITPAYAHSYLLTSIVSPDYVDSDLTPGPSDNDLGTYTRFDYKKLDRPFKWRTPYQANYANHNEGLKSDPGDDKAMISYGEKEIWYLEKIETKNLVAVFTTEEREDAHEVTDHNGGYSATNQSMHLLRKIELFAKKDFKDNYSGGTAVPIKVVHFEYDYSLCPGVPNNPNTNGGKLTLKKVYFTYGTSEKSAHNAYTFTYGNNPGYQNMGNDMWGSYKPNDNPKPKVTDATKSNTEFPYTDQDKGVTDAHVMAWSLTDITLPNSGTISVTYESDDYAYVQDKRAMELFEVVGATTTKPTTSSDVTSDIGELFTGPYGAKVENLYLIIKLKEDIPNNPDAFPYFRDRYLHNIGENVFFKFMMNVKSPSDPFWENVEGYMDVEDDIHNTNHFSLLNVGGGDYNHAFIKIKSVDIGDWEVSQNVNPIAKASWQYGRMNMSKYLNQNFDPEDGGIEQNMKKLVSTNIFKNLYATIVGPNRIYRDQNFGKEFLTNRSYIRLGEPRRAKLGGGLRVKQIVMSDNWNTMVNQPGYVTSYYGKEYNYTTTDPVNGETISSGVAASEPSTGGGESPLITPIFSKDVKKKVLAPDDRFYVTTPVGKAIFPSPQVGYSKVTITDLTIGNPVGSSVTRHATGKTIKEFYTARDFPVIVEMTGLDLELARNIPKTGLFMSYSRDFATASQGFSIQLNDMHGKPKAEWVYEEGKADPISGSEYTYKQENYGESSFKLTNSADVLLPDGSVTTGQIGVETDVTFDLRQYYAGSTSGSVQVNFESTTAGAIPLVLGTVWPDLGVDETRFRSATISKVISRYGLIEKVTAFDLGSSIDTENLAYDSETGGVLLTRTQNEFEDNIFSLSLPAYWYYDLMGPAYKSDNLITTDVAIDISGYASIENADQRYVRGDIVIASNGMLGWVTEVNQSNVKLVTQAGVKFPTTASTDLKTVRSGRRNLQAGMMGTVTTKQNPIYSFGKNSYPEVLSASVQLYKEGWGTWCDCFSSSPYFRITDNEYLTAQKGIYRPYKSLTYLTGRTQSVLNNNTNIRVDGEFKGFNPYWVFSDKGITIDDANWTWVQEATIFSPSGVELENMDALNRYSSALYGYNHALPTAVSKNAQYREIGFDNFEDYEYESCDDDHFSWRDFTPDVQTQESHTGKYSIRVNAGSSKVITKNVEACP